MCDDLVVAGLVIRVLAAHRAGRVVARPVLFFVRVVLARKKFEHWHLGYISVFELGLFFFELEKKLVCSEL